MFTNYNFMANKIHTMIRTVNSKFDNKGILHKQFYLASKMFLKKNQS